MSLCPHFKDCRLAPCHPPSGFHRGQSTHEPDCHVSDCFDHIDHDITMRRAEINRAQSGVGALSQLQYKSSPDADVSGTCDIAQARATNQERVLSRVKSMGLHNAGDDFTQSMGSGRHFQPSPTSHVSYFHAGKKGLYSSASESIGSPVGSGAFLSTLYLNSSGKSLPTMMFLPTAIISDLGMSNL